MAKNDKNYYRLKDDMDWIGDKKNTTESSTEPGGW